MLLLVSEKFDFLHDFRFIASFRKFDFLHDFRFIATETGLSNIHGLIGRSVTINCPHDTNLQTVIKQMQVYS